MALLALIAVAPAARSADVTLTYSSTSGPPTVLDMSLLATAPPYDNLILRSTTNGAYGVLSGSATVETLTVTQVGNDAQPASRVLFTNQTITVKSGLVVLDSRANISGSSGDSGYLDAGTNRLTLSGTRGPVSVSVILKGTGLRKIGSQAVTDLQSFQRRFGDVCRRHRCRSRDADSAQRQVAANHYGGGVALQDHPVQRIHDRCRAA
jgi:hypothetical protein